MKRFRVSTLLLLVVIAALGMALMGQYQRHRRREAELQTMLAVQAKQFTLKHYLLNKRYMELQTELYKREQSVAAPAGADGGLDGDK